MTIFMAAGFPGRIDAFVLFFASCIWISGATSRFYPPRTLRPRASDMFTYLARDPFDQKVSLILQANDMNVHPQIEQTDLHRLRGLYNHLREHPALMDSRLLVASRHPDMDVDHDAGFSDTGYGDSLPEQTKRISKRKLELPLTEACPSVTEWISLNRSRDIHDNEVEVFQPNGSEEEAQLGAQVSRDQVQQFFYSTRCIEGVESQPCTGISFLYRSKCLTRKGYVMALVRKMGNPEATFDWNWIQVPVSCNCAVSQKI